MGIARCSIGLAIAFSTFAPWMTSETIRLVDRPDRWAHAWRALAAESSDGFVVWESHRTGHWRIWRRELDGTGLRAITFDAADRDHFAPHISPDGTRFVYATLPRGINFYREQPASQNGELWLANADGTEPRRLAPRIRSYFEDRVALWIDDDSLYYIDGDGTTQRLTISTGATEPRMTWDEPTWGWLPNRAETHATAGWPMFAPFDKAEGRVLFRQRLAGCQPYFSHDNRWGYFTGGGGGPILRYDLATRRFEPIVEQHDPRLPEPRRYVYFPMLSACQNAFAFGASCYEHHHFESDYDIFVAPIDPFTLELEGDPVRYTFDPACDRFPDVHYSRLRLGKLRGAAPFVAEFEPVLDARDWVLHYGDGSAPTASRSHSYASPGSYWVTASVAGEVRRGRVRVDPPGPAIAEPEAVVARTAWPARPDGLVFAFEHGAVESLVPEYGSGIPLAFAVEPRGAARFDRAYALSPHGGEFVSERGGRNIGSAYAANDTIAFEAAIEPARSTQHGTIFGLETRDGTRLLSIEQRDTGFAVSAANGSGAAIERSVSHDGSPCHLYVGIRSDPVGAVFVAVDGEQRDHATDFEFTAPDARADRIVIGTGWRGAIHHVAVFARLRTGDELLQGRDHARAWRASLPKVERRAVTATLVARSATPTDIEYPDALAVYEWETDSGRRRVVHWVVRDRRVMPVAELELGARLSLEIEPFEAHPECASSVMSDTLEEDFTAELWFDARQ